MLCCALVLWVAVSDAGLRVPFTSGLPHYVMMAVQISAGRLGLAWLLCVCFAEAVAGLPMITRHNVLLMGPMFVQALYGPPC